MAANDISVASCCLAHTVTTAVPSVADNPFNINTFSLYSGVSQFCTSVSVLNPDHPPIRNSGLASFLEGASWLETTQLFLCLQHLQSNGKLHRWNFENEAIHHVPVSTEQAYMYMWSCFKCIQFLREVLGVYNSKKQKRVQITIIHQFVLLNKTFSMRLAIMESQMHHSYCCINKPFSVALQQTFYRLKRDVGSLL